MSEIRAATVSNLAGTGPVTLTGQSAAKMWFSFNQDNNNNIIRDSLNVSSATDIGTGRFNINYTNSMANANYGAASGGGGTIRNNTLSNIATPDSLFASGSIGVDCQYQHAVAFDPPRVTVSAFGDLA